MYVYAYIYICIHVCVCVGVCVCVSVRVYVCADGLWNRLSFQRYYFAQRDQYM